MPPWYQPSLSHGHPIKQKMSRRAFTQLAARYTTVSALASLTGCVHFTPPEKKSFTPVTATKIPTAQIGMDEHPGDLSHALQAHHQLATQSLLQCNLHDLTVQTVWSHYTCASLFAPYTNDAPHYYRQLGLTTTDSTRLPVVAALLGEQNQWLTPPSSPLIPPTTPSLILNRGIFIQRHSPLPPSTVRHWKYWFNQGYFSTNFSRPTVQAEINEWLTINSGTELIRQTLPVHPQILCWDIWLCASAWGNPYFTNNDYNFYPVQNAPQLRNFFTLTGNFPTDTHNRFTTIELPLADRLAMRITFPTDMPNWDKAHKIHYSTNFHTWHSSLVHNSVTHQHLPFTRKLLLTLPAWKTTDIPDNSPLITPDTPLPHLTPPDVQTLNSCTGQVVLAVNAQGVGPQEYPLSSRLVPPSAHTQFPSLTVDIPFLYRIIDTSSGMIFFQGIMHGNDH